MVLRAAEAGFCSERTHLIKEIEETVWKLRCRNRIETYFGCRSKLELSSAFIQFLSSPWSVDPFTFANSILFHLSLMPHGRDQQPSTSNGVVLL